LAVNANGVIVVTTQNTGSKQGDCILTLTPQTPGLPDITKWVGSSSGCDAKYVPSNFR